MSSALFRRSAAVSANAARAFSTTSARPLAKITIIGNLTDSPELIPTSTGRELVRYSVASNSARRIPAFATRASSPRRRGSIPRLVTVSITR